MTGVRIVLALLVTILPARSDADVAVADFDLGLMAGYTFVETGQATKFGPVVGHDRHVGPITLRGEYAHLFWIESNADGATGHEGAASFAVQAGSFDREDLVRRRRYVEVGATLQRLWLEHAHETNALAFVGAGLDFRGRRHHHRFFYGLTMNVRVSVGPAIEVHDRREDVPMVKGRDWSLLMTVGNGVSF